MAAKKTGPAKKKPGTGIVVANKEAPKINKSEYIRQYPEMSPKALSEQAASEGIEISPNVISTTRYQDAKRAGMATPGQAKGKPGPKPKGSTNGNFDELLKLKKQLEAQLSDVTEKLKVGLASKKKEIEALEAELS